MTRLKICGVTNEPDAYYISSLGVDFIGFIFVENTPRSISLSKALAIKGQLSKEIKSVGVFKNHDIDLVNKYADKIGLDLVQLHGKESNKYLEKIEKPVIKTVEYDSVSSQLIDPSALNELQNCKYILLDKPKHQKCQTEFSGLKRTVEMVKKKNKPFFLAGGISLENLDSILKSIRPFAIDICSSVEISPAQKSLDEIKKFVDVINRKDSHHKLKGKAPALSW